MNRELLTAILAALDAQRAVVAELLNTPASLGGADLIGQQFGELTVIARAPNRRRNNGKPRAYWQCRCSCGATVDVRADHLRHGTRSCGHLSRAARFKRPVDQPTPKHTPPAQPRMEQRAKPHATRGAHSRVRATEFAERLRPLIAQAVADGCTLPQIADRLNAAGTRARYGGPWTANAVYGVLCRLGLKTRRAKTEHGATTTEQGAPLSIEQGAPLSIEQGAPLSIEQGAAAPANVASTIEQGEAPAYWSEP